MIEKNDILHLVEEILEGTDKFVTTLRILPGNRIVVFIDSDSSVQIDDCAALSRKIEAGLDREKEDFELEVSSHGLTQGLLLPRQFKKNTGKLIDVVMTDGTKLTGTLMASDENQFILQITQEKKSAKNSQPDREQIIQYNNTKKVTLHISFK